MFFKPTSNMDFLAKTITGLEANEKMAGILEELMEKDYALSEEVVTTLKATVRMLNNERKAIALLTEMGQVLEDRLAEQQKLNQTLMTRVDEQGRIISCFKRGDRG